MSFFIIILGLFLLIKCADMFVEGSCNIANFFKVPTLIIGLTIIAFGTSAPEAAVSITASLKHVSDIAVGNVVGSNICNILLVLGLSGFFKNLVAKRKVIKRDYIYMLVASLFLLIIACVPIFNGSKLGILNKTSGMCLLLLLVVYLYLLFRDVRNASKTEEIKKPFHIKDIFYIVFGLGGIILGGNLVVNSAIKIAKIMAVSDTVIALTIVAVGTSLPELVTSVIATKKGQTDIAIGNVIGSNIFNILFILGLSSVIEPLSISITACIDIILMTFFSIIVFIFLLKKGSINRRESIMMLLMYLFYMIYILIR